MRAGDPASPTRHLAKGARAKGQELLTTAHLAGSSVETYLGHGTGDESVHQLAEQHTRLELLLEVSRREGTGYHLPDPKSDAPFEKSVVFELCLRAPQERHQK